MRVLNLHNNIFQIPQPQFFDMPDADVVLYKGLLLGETADAYFNNLRDNIQWQNEEVKLMGKTFYPSRLTAYYGEKPYRYSGVTRYPLPWIPGLLEIKSIIEPITGVIFNAVLLNFYKNGNDYMGWHSDDERELVEHSPIASVSLGETRRFIFRQKSNRQNKIEMSLSNGDLLIMQGTTQKYWHHQVPKTRPKNPDVVKARINLTFRVMA